MRSKPAGSPFLPVTREEALRERGWPELDVVLVSGDAYVDHPAFGAALIGRWLESLGWRVGILPQPDWRSAEPFRALGRPRLFFGVTAGNLDSMLSRYTARRRLRSEDAYAPGGQAGLRPDRAGVAYAQRAREAFPGVPVVLGGIEASLRRLAHYDYWSDTVRRSILLDAKAELLAFGMAERAVAEIARRLAAGEPLAALRGIRGTGVRLSPAEIAAAEAEPSRRIGDGRAVVLPAFEEVRDSPEAFARLTRLAHAETNPGNARPLVQRHGAEGVRLEPPAPPLSSAELDALHELPFRRETHPAHRRPVPALETVRHSVTVARGCGGGCAFCALSLHQGRIVQSRSAASVRREVERLAASSGWRGVISDLGAPTANLYGTACDSERLAGACRRPSCLHPRICRHLHTDSAPLRELLRVARSVPGVREVHVASGVRTDVAEREPAYLRELAAHHVGGQLSVAPEHVSERVLRRMRKPPRESFERFAERFAAAADAAGRELHLVPYLMSGHPGCTLEDMIELALWLKRHGYRPRQVQEFIPTPGTVATAMYRTGLDPTTLEPVPVARGDREKRLQKALLFWWDPAWHEPVREALGRAGRQDLIGRGPECLVPPPGRPRRTEGGGPRTGRGGRR